ncbi:protease modulator HflC [Aestuariivirga sp.]|uniref:protease modulator HflC n=1 Tax=Aestuariivirga sp. TaxID=2650926 RepID=UPI0039E3AA57
MSTIRNIAGVIIAAVLFIAYMSYFVVDERQKMIVQRVGEISRIVDAPGLYFKLPFLETVTPVEDRIILWESNDRPVQDKASQVYIVDAITLARISDARRFRETLGADLDQAETRVGALLDAALRQTYGLRSFDEVLSSDRLTMMKEIKEKVEKEAADLGIDIVDVRIRRTDLDGAVLQSTHERMRSERNALAAQTRSTGEAYKTRMNAETDRLFIEKTADARRRAEVIRGEGDAERNRIFAEAFQQDPDFFAFYRSLQAYSKALANKDTTLVLNPDSEFFRYFGGESKDQEQVPAPKQ